MASPDTNPPPLRIGFLKLVPADAPAASTRRERRDRAAAQRAATDQGGSPPHLRADGGEGRSRGRGGRGGGRGARRDYSTSAAAADAAADTATTMTTSSSSSSVSSSHLQQQNPRSGGRGGGGFAFPIIRRSSPVPSSSLPPQAQSDLQRRLKNLPPIPPASSSQQQARQPRKPRIDPFASYPQFDYRTQCLDPSKDTPMLYYARTVEEADEALAKLGPGPLGFDLEWKPTYVKGARENPVALVQLADGERIVLVQLSLMSSSIPSELRRILEDGLILKLGVGIHADATKLLRDTAVQTRGCLDLNDIAPKAEPNEHGKSPAQGLAKFCGTYLNKRLAKGKVQTSDWSRPLSAQQQQYAVNDVHAPVCIFHSLRSRALASPPTISPVWPLPLGKAGGNYVDPPVLVDSGDGGWGRGGGKKWEFRWESMRVERA